MPSIYRRDTRARAAAAAFTIALAVLASLVGASTNAQAASESNLFGTTVPVIASAPDPVAVELGVAFVPKVNGSVKGVRFYKASDNTGLHTGSLWNAAGSRLATATFTNETASGWQFVEFANPMPVTAGQRYVASYYAPRGRYAVAQGFLDAPYTRDDLIVPTNGGVFRYGTSGFPSSTYRGSNYYVDLEFSPATDSQTTRPTTPPPTTTPLATSPPPTTPGPTTTGVPSGTSLTASGGFRVTRANTVLTNLDIFGQVSIEAWGVVIKNSKIHGSGMGNAVQVRSGSLKISDSEIYGFENGIGGGDWEAYRVNIHSMTGDGIKLGSNTLVEDSWIHDLTPGPGAHSDGIQVQSGIVNANIRNNNIDLSQTPSANAALFIAPDLGPSSTGPLLVKGNYFDGGNYTVQVLDGDYGKYYFDRIEFRDNTWGRLSSYGPVRTNVPVVWVNATFADTGAAIEIR